MSRTAWAWARVLGGLAVLAFIGWRLGAGPFLDGVRAVDGWSVVLAVLITAVTTTASAWRWQVIARGLDVGMPLPAAIAAYYRSQFLNAVLPGGILGDVHRGVDHGRSNGSVGAGLRAVVWERVAGQAVQVAVATVVLIVLPSPWHPDLVVALAVGAVVVLAAAALVRFAPISRGAWAMVLGSSAVVVAGHVALFVVAAHAVGVDAGVRVLLPLVLLALLGAALPTNVGGWGPREGVAAWAFGAAGLGAASGVAAATAFGVLVLIASLPGAVVLGSHALRRRPVFEPVARFDRHLVGARHG